MCDKLVEPAVPQLAQKTKRPLLRTASFDDYDQITAVQAANGLATKPRDQWLHLWQANPAYRQLSNWPMGWVLEDESKRIVGSLENIPCLYRLGGRSYVGAFGRGWAVDIAYRAFALVLMVRQQRQPGVDLRVTTTASPRTSAVLQKGGWLRVPVGQWNRSAFWVTNYAKTVTRYLSAKAPTLVSAIAGPLLYPPLWLTDFAAARLGRFRTEYELRWSAGFDEPFDQFWADLESRNPGVLLSVRTAQTLRWHFKFAIEQKRAWILTAWDGPRLFAYAILERRDAQSPDLVRVLLIDFQALVRDRDLASAMVSFILSRCRREHIQVLDNVGCWLAEKQPIANRPPHYRGLGGWSYLYQPANQELADALSDAEPWYPTPYDADASL
jgi:hypothetical protein